MKDIATILLHYLAAALWTSENEEEYSYDDFSPEASKKAEEDITRFVTEAGPLLEAWPEDQIGHDFWLTRCGHGTGFWDRTEWPNGEALSKICESYRMDVSVHACEDGTLIIE